MQKSWLSRVKNYTKRAMNRCVYKFMTVMDKMPTFLELKFFLKATFRHEVLLQESFHCLKICVIDLTAEQWIQKNIFVCIFISGNADRGIWRRIILITREFTSTRKTASTIDHIHLLGIYCYQRPAVHSSVGWDKKISPISIVCPRSHKCEPYRYGLFTHYCSHANGYWNGNHKLYQDLVAGGAMKKFWWLWWPLRF